VLNLNFQKFYFSSSQLKSPCGILQFNFYSWNFGLRSLIFEWFFCESVLIKWKRCIGNDATLVRKPLSCFVVIPFFSVEQVPHGSLSELCWRFNIALNKRKHSTHILRLYTVSVKGIPSGGGCGFWRPDFEIAIFQLKMVRFP